MLDQRLAALRADARDLVEERGRARFAAPCPVSDHRKAVCFVADRLNEMQARMRRCELQRARLGLEYQLFLAGLALRPLGDAGHADLVQTQVPQDGSGDVDLPSAAVDQDEVRNLARLGGHALV